MNLPSSAFHSNLSYPCKLSSIHNLNHDYYELMHQFCTCYKRQLLCFDAFFLIAVCNLQNNLLVNVNHYSSDQYVQDFCVDHKSKTYLVQIIVQMKTLLPHLKQTNKHLESTSTHLKSDLFAKKK